jgi:hypothetical protein
MSPGPDKIDLPVNSIDARKQHLVLACMADRAAWCQACEPRPQTPLSKAGNILKMLEPLTFLLPGRLGRWVRRAEFLTVIGRQIGSFL